MFILAEQILLLLASYVKHFMKMYGTMSTPNFARQPMVRPEQKTFVLIKYLACQFLKPENIIVNPYVGLMSSTNAHSLA